MIRLQLRRVGDSSAGQGSLYSISPARRVYIQHIYPRRTLLSSPPCRTVSPALFQTGIITIWQEGGVGDDGFKYTGIPNETFGAEVLATRAQIPSICQANMLRFPLVRFM